MELTNNEVLVKDWRVMEKCIGTQKTNTDVMLSFTKMQDDFEFVDVFMTYEQIEGLRNNLNWVLDDRNL